MRAERTWVSLAQQGMIHSRHSVNSCQVVKDI